MVEGVAGLALIIGEDFRQRRAELPFLLRELAQRPQPMLDALYRAERVFGIRFAE